MEVFFPKGILDPLFRQNKADKLNKIIKIDETIFSQ